MFSGAIVYYFFKPMLSRRLQLALRRWRFNLMEKSTRDIWPIDHSSVKPPVGWQGWPQGKEFAVLISHDVESQRGMKKCRNLAEVDMQFGLKSSFNLVPRNYIIPAGIRSWLIDKGFEIGIHDYNHDGKLFSSIKVFDNRAVVINEYIKRWNAQGFRTGSIPHSFDYMQKLNILYDSSTFDTDPFEPQPDGVSSIFPFWYDHRDEGKGFVEIPYTLPQDFTLFVIKKEADCRIWKDKLKWIVQNKGMASVIVHPDYIHFDENKKPLVDEYAVKMYVDFLSHISTEYKGRFWNPLPKEMATFVKNCHFKKINNPELREVESQAL
jgi:hypothetical protein